MGAITNDKRIETAKGMELKTPHVSMDPLSFSSVSSKSSASLRCKTPPKLRRSNLDLGQIRLSSKCFRDSFSLSSSSSASHAAADDEVFPNRKNNNNNNNNNDDTINKTEEKVPVPLHTIDQAPQKINGSEDIIFYFFSLMGSIVASKAGFREILQETRHFVQNVIGFLFHSIFASNSTLELNEMDASIPAIDGGGHTFYMDSLYNNNNDNNNNNLQQQKQHHRYSDETLSDPPLSPARVKTAQNSGNPRDEWGHFADFVEELADEKSFIPTCAHKSSSKVVSTSTTTTTTTTSMNINTSLSSFVSGSNPYSLNHHLATLEEDEMDYNNDDYDYDDEESDSFSF